MIQNHPTDSNTLYAGTDFGLYRSTDAGANWARYGSGLPMVAVLDLYVAPDGSFLRVGTYGRGVWEIQPSAAATAPTFTTHPLSQTVALGQTATFTATATGNPAPTYQWKKDGVDIPTATNASYTTAATISGDNGASFTVVATNSVSTVTSNAAILTVVTPIAPAITSQPQNFNSGLVGGSASFTVTATGTEPFTYAWTKNGSAVGTNNATLTLNNLLIGDNNAQVAVTVSNAGGSTPSAAATLRVRTRDLSGDTAVDVLDLAYIARVYGTNDTAADLNGDGTVNDADLDILLAGL